MRAELVRVPIVLVTGVAALGLAGVAWLAYDDGSAPPIVIADPRPDATIVVQVEGAVAVPGVYPLAADARAQDALAAAGGAVADADLGALNLARRLRDEDLILVPRVAPVAPVSTAASAVNPTLDPTESAPAPVPAPPAAVAAGTIDLNRASASELDLLPEIGPVLAQRIVDHRTANGPFHSVDDLSELPGISERMVDQLRPLVTVGE